MLYDVPALEGYDPEIGMLAAMLQDGTREWREELGDVDEDAIVWQPFPGSHSIGALILHMIECEVWWIESVAAGKELDAEAMKELMSEEIKQYSVEWPTPPNRPLSYFLDLQDRHRARSIETMKEFCATTQVKMKSTEEDSFTLRWIINHLVGHEAYHGGQAVFLKLLHERTV